MTSKTDQTKLLFHSLLDNTPAQIVCLDNNFTIQQVNQKFAKAMGQVSTEFFRDKAFFDLLPCEETKRLCEQVLVTGEVYVHKGKPYFVESLVRVDEETKLAAVMYYPDPAQVPEWENIEKGSKVKYSGVIKTVHIDTVVSKDPFAFVDLKGVKPTKVIE